MQTIVYRNSQYCIWDCGSAYVLADEYGRVLAEDFVSFDKEEGVSVEDQIASLSDYFKKDDYPVKVRSPGAYEIWSVFQCN